jgi:G:T-mismatch repair DNA endonuclease (very short patch repair protein)
LQPSRARQSTTETIERPPPPAAGRRLAALGWRVLRVWEHELESGDERRLAGRLRRLKERL